MRLGLYGGTFDPVHQGHIHAALSSYQYLSLSEVRMILAARPDHRDQPDTPNVHRWEMYDDIGHLFTNSFSACLYFARRLGETTQSHQ